MKYNKIILMLCIAMASNACFAQFWSGTYNTKYGMLKLFDEIGPEYPNGSIVYGDYGDKGTIVGSLTDQKRSVEGTFDNGTNNGRFKFRPLDFGSLVNKLYSFTGNWGFGQTLNVDSKNTDEQWDGERKQYKMPTDNKVAVWSGKWNTNDGYIILQQTGREVKGVYKGVGTIDALYNTGSRILKGKFFNSEINKYGYLEFKFKGNSFTGKWGWTAAMTEGEWSGSKAFKTNMEIATPANTTTNNQPQNNTKADSRELLKYDFKFDWIHHGGDDETDGVYGIGWCRLFVKNYKTGVEERVMPDMFKYLDGDGRVLEIPRKNNFEMKTGHYKTLAMNYKVRFQLRAADYGYDTKDELLDNAYFKITFEVKEKGTFSDDIFGKESTVVRLKDAYIAARTNPQMYSYKSVVSKATNGLILMRKGEESYSIFYSFVKPD